MTRLELLTAELRRIADKPGDDNYAKDFENVLAKFVDLEDPDMIGALIDFFDDDAPFDEIMFSIVHTIEKFEDKVYIDRLLSKTAALLIISPRWAEILYMRILNSEPTRQELIGQICTHDDETRAAIIKIMDSINSKQTQFAEKILAVLNVATK